MIAASEGTRSVAEVHPAASVRVRGWRSEEPQTDPDGRLRLQSERRWVIEGPRAKLAEIEAALPASTWNRAGSGALVLNLVNSVGVLELPHVGQVELYSGKLGEADFETLLADLTELATSLPFSARDPGSSPWDSGLAPRDEVLYHAFVYLRYILSEAAPADARLIPALELIQREPYRRWRTERREVPIEALARVDSRTLLDLVTRAGTPVQSSSLSASGAALATRLGGRIPEAVSERRIRTTIDTPENRFVKAFIGQAQGIIGRTRAAVEGGRSVFETNLLSDCDRMDAALMPIVRHSMWEEAGTMARIPFSSTVLQRRRGYRHVLRHFARIRLAPRIPLDSRQMRDLLELKDIAVLYELWTFFRLAEIICELLGPPVRSARPYASDDFQVSLGWNRTFEWAGGTRLAYNESFSRSRWPPNHSYSVPLRPDIALHVREGPNRGLHLLDAKFRVQTLRDAGFEKPCTGDRQPARDDEADNKTGERRGDFTRADLYKMHTYRDAIHEAHSVWILYPGSEFHFFHASGDKPASGSPKELPESICGVGAIPFTPKPAGRSADVRHATACSVLRRLLGQGPT
ncbi:DUF2357 domain-containing protein [Candidatus Palauibacter sp.]|uniref:DUF2357 domain-containing protein n=1 Tax=Candidatus Palauibacter sp. TaxID=3101350 RepID=UPI003B017572